GVKAQDAIEAAEGADLAAGFSVPDDPFPGRGPGVALGRAPPGEEPAIRTQGLDPLLAGSRPLDRGAGGGEMGESPARLGEDKFLGSAAKCAELFAGARVPNDQPFPGLFPDHSPGPARGPGPAGDFLAVRTEGDGFPLRLSKGDGAELA